MKSKDTSKNKRAYRKAVVSLVAAMGLAGQYLLTDLPAGAQGMNAGQADLLSQADGLSPSKDSLLPPPVVPIDPGAITNATSQSGNSELNLEISSNTSAPGQNMNMNSMTSGFQNARDLRQAAFNSLMTKGTLSQLTSLNDPTLNSQVAGGTAFDQAIAQPEWLRPSSFNLSPYASSGQTQTLTAGAKIPIVRRDIRKRGLGNNIAGFMGIGAGLLTGTLNRPNSLMGLGITGLTMTGFGSRNGFRF